MGGASAGEVALEMAIKIIPEAYYRPQKVPALAPKEAVEIASAEIHRTAQSDLALRGMGTRRPRKPRATGPPWPRKW
jgi:hypothetical protein